MLISFNLRLSYEEAQECIKHMESLGGKAAISVGGSWYDGTKEQIDKLIMFMAEKGYDLASMSIDEKPLEARNRRVQQLKDKGIIE